MITAVTLKNGKTKFVARHGHGGKQRRFDTEDEAKTFLLKTARPNNKLINRSQYKHSWPNYVVPTHALQQVVNKHISTLDPRMSDDPRCDGRIQELGERISAIRRTTTEACLRRLYDVTHNTSKVIQADFADATCLAFGLHIDNDTELPTLPGNRPLARQLVAERANFLGMKLTPEELDKYADQTQRLAILILHYPHNTERLSKLAPLDCLRGYR